jgi:hypothetical protein
MPRVRIAGGLALVVACGFVNPIAKSPDGAMPRSRLRVGISSATLQEECWYESFCSVQLDMGHFDETAHRVEIVAVRLLVGDFALGTVPTGETTRWNGGAYRAWDNVVEPSRTAKLSVPIERIDWPHLLAPLGDPDPTSHDIRVEVELECDGERLSVRSIFGITPTRREFIVT